MGICNIRANRPAARKAVCVRQVKMVTAPPRLQWITFSQLTALKLL